MTRPSRSWTDLYAHGERLNTTIKMLNTNMLKDQEDGNYSMVLQWQEAIRKYTMNCVDVAKTVLGVEEIVRGKKIVA